MTHRILAINLGSSSTKIAVFDNNELFLEKVFRHDPLELLKYENSIAQKEFRKQVILDFVKENNYNLKNIDVFVGRGGLIKPVEGGTYLVNDLMVRDLSSMKYGDHVSNLGAIIAYDFAQEHNKKAYTVNPVIIDELDPLARISGFNGIERRSIFHALNHKAVGNRYAKSIGKQYQDLNLIVTHMGGGISVALHKKGKVVDVNNALGGEGPFTPERAGTLPISSVIDFWNENPHLSAFALKRLLVTKGGLFSYIGTSSGFEISERVNNGDKKALFYVRAMLYQVVKHIGSLYFAAKGDIDALIFTGGLVYQQYLKDELVRMLPKNLNLVFYPGEDEMFALAEGVLRVLNKEESEKHYL